MNPFAIVTRPIRDLVRAVTLPFTAVAVVGLTGTINALTFSGTWWFGWVALGMGIAVAMAWARVARTALTVLLIAWVGRWILRRYGPELRAAFDEWVARTRPRGAEVVDLWRAGEARLRGLGGEAGPGVSPGTR